MYFYLFILPFTLFFGGIHKGGMRKECKIFNGSRFMSNALSIAVRKFPHMDNYCMDRLVLYNPLSVPTECSSGFGPDF